MRGEGRAVRARSAALPVTVVNRQCWEPRVAWSSVASDGFSVLVLREGVGATRLIWHCMAPLPGSRARLESLDNAAAVATRPGHGALRDPNCRPGVLRNPQYPGHLP